jgi:hypothetical protein
VLNRAPSRMNPTATEMLLLADSGGTNAARTRAWKYNLQTKLCDRHPLTVTVCHYPTSASKWNAIEHRMLSEHCKNCAGRPLDSYQTILNYARTTRTKTGLHIDAYLVRADYPTGVEISDADIKQLRLQPHHTQPTRNYTLSPTIPAGVNHQTTNMEVIFASALRGGNLRLKQPRCRRQGAGRHSFTVSQITPARSLPTRARRRIPTVSHYGYQSGGRISCAPSAPGGWFRARAPIAEYALGRRPSVWDRASARGIVPS